VDTIEKPAEGTALITGASGGIGLEFAKIFSREGYDLVLVARTEGKLQKVKSELEKRRGISVRVIRKDLADPRAPAEIYNELEQQGVRIDVLVNNAGYALFNAFVERDAKETLDMLQVNIMALTHLTRLFIPGMIERGKGRVLNMASTAAFVPGPLMACYYASKAYVLSFSEAIAEELRGTGVTVTALCPGATATGFQKRADMENSRLVQGRRITDPSTVARAGYKAMMQGKAVEVPGLANKAVPFFARLVPRGIVPRIVMRSQERRPGAQRVMRNA
jgi:short-subunit dehydrogenase